ncbi:MAG: zf-HC2 domain-containing protein [Ruminococcus sp.]|nr:zf-HC2 domain-containing protein [Ruminococcus sp.]
MNNKIPCSIITDLMPLYNEGLCAEESCEIVKAHLDECTECRRLLEKIEIFEDKPESIPDEAKAMRKINRKIKQLKKVVIASVCVLLAVLIPVVVLWENMIWQNEKIPSFETIAQNSEVKVLAEMIYEEDFKSLIYRITPGGIYGDKQTQTAVIDEKINNLESTYSALIGENKAIDTKCRTYYTFDVYEEPTNHKAVVSDVTVEYSDGRVLTFCFFKENGIGRFTWCCMSDGSFDEKLIEKFNQVIFDDK